jgi:hypothetical protein
MLRRTWAISAADALAPVDSSRSSDRTLDAVALRTLEKITHLIRQMRFQIADLARARRIIGQELLGEARDAQLEAAHPHRLAIADHHQLDAAAADIDQQMGSAFEPHRMTRGDENEACFLGAGNDFHLDAGFAPDAGHKVSAVLGLAHRAGRNRARPIDVAKFDELLEVAEGADREVHRFLAEGSGFEGAPAEANGLLDAVDDIDVTVAIHVGDHHVQ